MRRRWCTALLLAAWAVCAAAQQSATSELTVGGQRLTVEVAAQPEQRERGLMYRRMLPENYGMLFVFDAPQMLRFWMKNTYLPLSIAFIDADGVIVNITDMKPRTLNTHSSVKPAQYALEVNQGWFKRHGIAAGARVGDLAHLATTPTQ